MSESTRALHPARKWIRARIPKGILAPAPRAYNPVSPFTGFQEKVNHHRTALMVNEVFYICSVIALNLIEAMVVVWENRIGFDKKSRAG